MLVKTKTILAGDRFNPNDEFSYESRIGIYEIKVVDIIFCCHQMDEAFNEGYIGFGDKEYGVDNYVNIYHLSYEFWDKMPIKFCPFCKEEIKIENVETVELIKKKKKVVEEITNYIEKPVKEPT